MEGERRKRKLENEEENDEERQMEKFYDLIKSMKDSRDHLSKGKEEKKEKGVWNPTFQLEDFIHDVDLSRIDVLHPLAGPSGKGQKREAIEKESPEATAAAEAENENKKKESDNLDLSLSLS